MRPSFGLLQKCRITLFTRANCSLCTDAKHTLSSVWDVRQFKFREVDVMASDQTMWRDLYEFDVPVIHISKADDLEENPDLSGKAKKLMHRFTAEEVHKKMDQAEGSSS